MLLQLVGPAVAVHVQETLHASFGDRFRVSENLRRVVDAGHRTLLAWDESGRQVLDPEIAALWRQGDRPSTADQVRARALDALAQEARMMLDEGVVADPADIDLAMITGAGMPFWLGRHHAVPRSGRRLRAGRRPAVRAARGGHAARVSRR